MSSSSRPFRRISIRAASGQALHCNTADHALSAVTWRGGRPSAEALRGAANPIGTACPR